MVPAVGAAAVWGVLEISGKKRIGIFVQISSIFVFFCMKLSLENLNKSFSLKCMQQNIKKKKKNFDHSLTYETAAGKKTWGKLHRDLFSCKVFPPKKEGRGNFFLFGKALAFNGRLPSPDLILPTPSLLSLSSPFMTKTRTDFVQRPAARDFGKW